MSRTASPRARRRSPISPREPATAEHIATKFARHFVADSPDPALVAPAREDVSATRDGDLAALARALVADDAAWRAPATKMRNPWELTVAAYRAFGRSPSDPGPALDALNLLGMPLWQPGGPNGFSDDSVAAWASPEGHEDAASNSPRSSPRQIKDAPRPPALARGRARPGRLDCDARGGGARRDAASRPTRC